MGMNNVLPVYSVFFTSKKTGKKYDITDCVTGLNLSEEEKEIAQKAEIELKQTFGIGTKGLADTVKVHDIVEIKASFKGATKAIFKGYVWDNKYQKSSQEKIVTLTCYDPLIYLQQSEDCRYYPAKKQTKFIFTDICKRKGIKLDYQYKTISHPKLVIDGTLADVFLGDLLEPVRKKTGKRGILRFDKGKIRVAEEGEFNSTVYKFTKGEGGNIISSGHEVSMEELVTKVVICKSGDDKEKQQIAATVKGKVKEYGTLQKNIQKSGDDNLGKLKKEAKQVLKDYGKPKERLQITAIDNPFIRKGDKINLDDGYRRENATVVSVRHDGKQKTMEMELKLI